MVNTIHLIHDEWYTRMGRLYDRNVHVLNVRPSGAPTIIEIED